MDAADQAGAILRQCRALTADDLSATEAALLGLGWPPDENLVDWATRHSQLVPVTSIVINLATRLGDLRARNTQALQMLAMALRSDPRDPVQALPPLGPPAAPQAGGAGPDAGSGTAGSAQGRGLPASAALTAAGGVDRDNQDRLTADLHSSDVATLAMALGVRAALEKARASGGVAQLLVYESAGSGSQGRAAISVGDISTADNVATLAPGVSNAPVNMAEGISSAVALRTEAQRLAPGDATAVVAWYGYDIPLSAIRGVPVDPLTAAVNTAAALTDENARAGGALLVRRHRPVPPVGPGDRPVRRGRLFDGRDDRVRRRRPRRRHRRPGHARFTRRRRGCPDGRTTTRICRPSTPSRCPTTRIRSPSRSRTFLPGR